MKELDRYIEKIIVFIIIGIYINYNSTSELNHDYKKWNKWKKNLIGKYVTNSNQGVCYFRQQSSLQPLKKNSMQGK